MPSTDLRHLRIHLRQTHRNEAADNLSWEEARDQHWHEHYGPGGLRLHTHEPELQPHPKCPWDTDGDGNCGRPACPYCGKYRREEQWSESTQTAVAVYLANWYDEASGFDTTPELGAQGLLAMLAYMGVLTEPVRSDGLYVHEDLREPACVANWPECHPGGYDPRCCRFPKSCSVDTRAVEKIQKKLIDPSRLNRYGFPKICEIPDCGCAGDAHA